MPKGSGGASPKDKLQGEVAEVKGEDVKVFLDKMDRFAPYAVRRQKGKFFTNTNVARIAAQKLWYIIKPDIILEPYAGVGSLIEPLLDKDIAFIVNDIVAEHIDSLEGKYHNNNCHFFRKDFITTTTSEILRAWHIPPFSDARRFLVYSNPPFGTISTNRLATKRRELDNQSRNVEINYGGLEARYGRGDLVIPAVAKMIELIRGRGRGFLAFYSPLGVFCGRQRYNKLLNQLLEDFDFLYGEIFSGIQFHDVQKNKPISLTFWQYNPGCHTPHEKLEFVYESFSIGFERMPLLKDGWIYDNRKRIRGEIAVQGNDRFNVQAPKMIHIQVEKGGSELISENVEKE
ncbi:MAG TPA: hypothetical protein VJ044_16190, partial [Candidatus Hodarchaeales archaeon]|nr:hypothetical protein [Candidatus Hodarchaeales archaeon]